MVDQIPLNDELGGRPYSDAEKELIMKIAVFLKNRDKDETMATFHGRHDPTAIRPRDYMPFYVKAAASVYELAKTLSTVVIRRQTRQKTVDDWLRILTGHRFHYITDGNLVRNVVDVHVSEPQSAKPTADGMPDVDVTIALPEPGRTHGGADGVQDQREPAEDSHEGAIDAPEPPREV